MERFLILAGEKEVPVFPAAKELVCACRDLGLKTALATSGEKRALEAIEVSSGVLWHELFDVVISSDDIDKSKPAPDVLQTAAAKLNHSPLQCALVGDTPYDSLSARKSGVAFLGVLSGGHATQSLISAGARGIWKNTADVLDHLDEALTAASPATSKLTVAFQEELMEQALAAAQDGMNSGEVPIGCALFDGAGRLLARSSNRMNATENKTAHAEIMTFAAAAGTVPLEDRTLIMVSTLEPCVMCTGAAMEAGVDIILYALPAPTDNGTTRVQAPGSPESQMPRIVGNVKTDASRHLFESWLSSNSNTPQADYVRQLLEANS